MTKSRNAVFALTLFAAVAFLGCGSKPPEEAKETPQPQQAAPPPQQSAPPEQPKAAPGTYNVLLTTSNGNIVIEVHPDWAPIGARHFRDLVESGFYNGARFFRVVPNFIVQFGLAANPAVTRKWDKPIPDDPVVQTNRAGSVTFATAGPNTRTTQLFINLRSNQSLDGQGFAPFGMVVQGMDVVEKIYPAYGEQPDQGAITSQGNAYLTAQFPKLDYIKTATIQ